MSLLIKGMEMPTGCKDCDLLVVAEQIGEYCPINSYLTWYNLNDVIDYRPDNCPLVEIPTPHGRLIDADRLIAILKSTTTISQSDYDVFNHILGLIEHQPIIIEAEE